MRNVLSILTPFRNQQKTIVRTQSVGDIISGIMATHNRYKSEYDKIASQFDRGNAMATAKSRELVDWLKWITAEYNILLIGVIHLGKKDNHTLGHFGSMIDRYAQSVLEVDKNKEYSVYTLKPKYLRSSADFTPQSIQFNGQYYSACTTPPDSKYKK